MLGRIPFAVFRSAYNGAKHYLNALTANFRAEIQVKFPDIQFSIISPGLVATEFGANARHGGPDSRTMPDPQSAEQVAEVLLEVIRSRQPDLLRVPVPASASSATTPPSLKTPDISLLPD